MYIPFKKTDIFYNRLKLYPKTEFQIYDRLVHYNNKPIIPGKNVTQIAGHMPGTIDLYENNVDRIASEYIYPFIIKDGSLLAFKTVDTDDYHEDYSYGDVVKGSYPLTASISRDYYALSSTRPYVDALQNVLNYNKKYSPHYNYNSSLGNKATQPLGMISIPSIFYGSSIKKGSVDLRFYITGSQYGRLQDIRRNGELVQTEGLYGSGSVAGVVLYTEGFIILTGSWDLSNTGWTEPYVPGAAATDPRWVYFASTGSTGAGENIPYTSFWLCFEGVNYVPTLTMLCHARRGEINSSQNPTWIKYGQKNYPRTSSIDFYESSSLEIKNITHSNWDSPTGSFEKIVYIDKVNIYDNNKRVIAVAKLAKPLRKREKDSLTFKLRYDFG